jgi:hypothetical protein
MSRILLQTTITASPDDWDIRRFSLLAHELRAAGHDVTARNRVNRVGDDLLLSLRQPGRPHRRMPMIGRCQPLPRKVFRQ